MKPRQTCRSCSQGDNSPSRCLLPQYFGTCLASTLIMFLCLIVYCLSCRTEKAAHQTGGRLGGLSPHICMLCKYISVVLLGVMVHRLPCRTVEAANEMGCRPGGSSSPHILPHALGPILGTMVLCLSCRTEKAAKETGGRLGGLFPHICMLCKYLGSTSRCHGASPSVQDCGRSHSGRWAAISAARPLILCHMLW